MRWWRKRCVVIVVWWTPPDVSVQTKAYLCGNVCTDTPLLYGREHLHTQYGEVAAGGHGAGLVGAGAGVLPLVGAPHGGDQQVTRVQDLPSPEAVRAILTICREGPSKANVRGAEGERAPGKPIRLIKLRTFPSNELELFQLNETTFPSNELELLQLNTTKSMLTALSRHV